MQGQTGAVGRFADTADRHDTTRRADAQTDTGETKLLLAWRRIPADRRPALLKLILKMGEKGGAV